MNDPLPKGQDPRKEETAAADWLLEDDEPKAAPPKQSAPPPDPSASSGFDLAAPIDVAPRAPAPAAFPPDDDPPAPQTRARSRAAQPTDGFEDFDTARPEPRARSRAPKTTQPTVEEVWSRGAEWGGTIILLLVWSALILGLLYVCLSSEWFLPALLVMVLGLAGFAFLSYPILITLERPVRITPEQAVRDYFNALSHHFPHYRRMWLLLSTRGRTSSQFASYEGFKSYWTKKMKQLREGHAGASGPLVFQIVEFKSEKSAGLSEIDVKFKLQVFIRGKRDQGPIWTLPASRSLVKGPDKMWYLEDGTLPEQSRADRAS